MQRHDDRTVEGATQTTSRPVILMAGKGAGFMPGTLDYSLGLAERMGADLLAVSVDTFPEYDADDEATGRTLRFASAAAKSAETLRARALERGLGVRHMCLAGKVTDVVSELVHKQKNVSFVLVEQDIPIQAMAATLPVPVFAVGDPARSAQRRADAKENPVTGAASAGAVTWNNSNKGVHPMATDTSKRQAKSKALLFGILSVGIYAAVFTNADMVMKYFTKGGFFNVLPVLTVFAVSYIHGSFASNVWTALGINASHKAGKPAATKTAPAKQAPRPRARMNA